MRVEIANRQDALTVAPRAIREVLEKAAELEGADAELSVALVGDAEIAELNRRFLGREGVTDVLAFPYEAGETVAGEVVVNAELAVREAAGRPHGAQDELMLYLVHGLLHLFGYNDGTEKEARRMRRREQEALKAAGRRVEF